MIFHGGSGDKQFLNDLVVMHLETGLWSRPVVSGGPSPRAFHSCAAIGSDVYFFGGRTGTRRHADTWKLDTNVWEWSSIQSLGFKPDGREKADFISIDDNRLLLFGGYDGIRWLNEVSIFHTRESEWTQLKVSGSLPPPRSGHKLVMIQHRMLLYGGDTTNSQYLGDLWALKGLFGEEAPKWIRMQLAGSSPSARSGHTFASAGTKLVIYGGQGDEGWLTRKDIYHKDVAIIDRESVKWMKTDVISDEPPERSFHSMLHIKGNTLLMFGGYNGKSTFGDIWFLDLGATSITKTITEKSAGESKGNSQEESSFSSAAKKFDPTFGIFGGLTKSAQKDAHPAKPASATNWIQPNPSDLIKHKENAAIQELRQRLGLPLVSKLFVGNTQLNDEHSLLVEIGAKLDPTGKSTSSSLDQESALARARSYFSAVEPENMSLTDIEALLYDYKAIFPKGLSMLREQEKDIQSFGKWNHVEYLDLGISDISDLLQKYRELLSASFGM